MTFPFSWSRTFNLPIRDGDIIDADSILMSLQKTIGNRQDIAFDHPRQSDGESRTLSFHVPFSFSGTNWDLLSYVDRGTVNFINHRTHLTIHYEIGFKRFIWIVTCFGMLALIMALTMPGSTTTVVIMIAVWLWTVVSAYAFSAIRFDMVMRRLLSETVKS
jgi:hypothetical protein